MSKKPFVLRQNAQFLIAEARTYSSVFRPETPIESGFSFAIRFNRTWSKAVSSCL